MKKAVTQALYVVPELNYVNLSKILIIFLQNFFIIDYLIKSDFIKGLLALFGLVGIGFFFVIFCIIIQKDLKIYENHENMLNLIFITAVIFQNFIILIIINNYLGGILTAVLFFIIYLVFWFDNVFSLGKKGY